MQSQFFNNSASNLFYVLLRSMIVSFASWKRSSIALSIVLTPLLLTSHRYVASYCCETLYKKAEQLSK